MSRDNLNVGRCPYSYLVWLCCGYRAVDDRQKGKGRRACMTPRCRRENDRAYPSKAR